jgi:hypothetical protein
MRAAATTLLIIGIVPDRYTYNIEILGVGESEDGERFLKVAVREKSELLNVDKIADPRSGELKILTRLGEPLIKEAARKEFRDRAHDHARAKPTFPVVTKTGYLSPELVLPGRRQEFVLPDGLAPQEQSNIERYFDPRYGQYQRRLHQAGTIRGWLELAALPRPDPTDRGPLPGFHRSGLRAVRLRASWLAIRLQGRVGEDEYRAGGPPLGRRFESRPKDRLRRQLEHRQPQLRGRRSSKANRIRVTGPVYVTVGPRRKSRVHWLFSGKGSAGRCSSATCGHSPTQKAVSQSTPNMVSASFRLEAKHHGREAPHRGCNSRQNHSFCVPQRPTMK